MKQQLIAEPASRGHHYKTVWVGVHLGHVVVECDGIFGDGISGRTVEGE